MSMAAGELPEPEDFSPSEQGELAQTVSLLQSSRLDFFHACGAFADSPTQESGDVISATVGDYAAAMKTHLAVLRRELSAAELAETGRELLLIEDAWRVDSFNGLLDEPKHAKLVDTEESQELTDALREELTGHADDEEQAKTCVHRILGECFADALVNDTELFVHVLSHSEKAKRFSNMSQLRRSIGKHALDVGKMTAAVAAGIVLSRLPATLRRSR